MTRKANPILASLCLSLPLLAAGCGRFKKPATVVHSLYMDCNNGEYPKALSLYSKELRENLDEGPSINSPGIKGACDLLTRSGTLSNIEIRDEAIQGDQAVVLSDLHFQNDNLTHSQRTHLIREDGAWKVSH